MKAKYYIGILSVLLLTGSTLKAQTADMRDFRNDGARIVVNNYYDDYDFYFSSRINRFHRSYSAFNYYAPVFTDTYWYNYKPYSWGLSIYGGGGFGIGYSYNYPVYNYEYDNGWYDPYFGSSYYRGYDPFYYNNWYRPVVINIGIRNRWSGNHNGWYSHNNYRGYNDYRPVHNRYNNYNNNSNSHYSSPKRPDRNSEPSSGNVSRRVAPSVNSPRNNVDRRESIEKSTNGLRTDESRRNTSPTVNRSQEMNNRKNAIEVEKSNAPLRRSSDVRNNNNYSNSNNVKTNTGSDIKSVNSYNVQENRKVERQAPVERRKSVSSDSGSNPSRTVSTPAKSSSSKSGTSSTQRRSSSSRSESKEAPSNSSSSNEKSTRRR